MYISVEANTDVNKSHECCYTLSIKQSIDVKINKQRKSKSLSATNGYTENS